MFTLPGLELGRFRRTTLARLATVVIAVIPALYACLYLASNWDPTANLERLDAAIVNADTGAQPPDGPGGPAERLDAGGELSDELLGSDASFRWHDVDADTASRGLADGTYTAVLRVPRDFSAAIVSSGTDDPRHAMLTLETDDAHNYIAGTVGQEVLDAVRESLNRTTTATYLDTVYVGFNEIQAKMAEASEGADQVASGAGQVHEGTGALVTGTGQARDGSAQLSTGLDDLSSGSTELATGTGTLADGAADLRAGTGRLAAGSRDAVAASQQLADGAGQVADGTGQLATRARAVDEAATRIRAGFDAFDQDAGPVIAEARQGLADAAVDTDALRDRAQAVAASYPDDPEAQRLASDLDVLASDLDEARGRVAERADRIDDARRTVRETVDGAADRIDAAADAVARLNDGAQQVADGAGRLHGGLVTLDDGIGQVDAGASDLAAGAAQVDAGATRLASGAQEAAAAGRELADGLVELDDGAGRLDEGARALDEGAGRLASGIAAGAEEVPTYPAEDRATRSDVVAVPVEGTATREHAVPTYGEGLAPFFLSLALWIGGMITYMVLNAIPYRALASSARSWRIAWSGYAPGAFFGVMQVLVAFAVLTFLLHFTVSSWLLTIAFAMLVAASFHAIHQLCVVAFGSLGRLVALVLLMLQIGAAGGTYPVGTTPAFFRAISPFLPMTHAVIGLRGLIAGGNTAGVVRAAVVLALFGAAALAASALLANRKRVVTVSRLYPSFQL